MSTDICRWLFLLFCLTTWATQSNSKEIRVVCYYTNWSVYRPGTAKFSPQNINPYLCTHLIYAFGGFTKENTLKPFDKYQDIEKGGYAKFTGLKTYNKNLKTMLAIGGWNEGSSRFSPMVANPERRKELVKNAIKFLRQNHFDGLDLDWEYPAFRDGGKSRDRDNYAKLVQELREEFDRESEKTGRNRLLLTMAVPAGIEYINKGYDVPKLTKYLDWMNILSYDYHSAFEPAVNHHAPLYSLEEESEYNYDGELNIDYTIKHYLKMGADPSKLVMGIPTYGRSYTLYNPDANEIGSPADGPGDMGDATRENGYLAYYEICDNVKSQEWEVVQPDPKVMGPYAFKENQWVGYDDEAIARKKSEYVVENGLGGIMFWSIDNDDFRGACHGKPYPIIEAAKEALISALGLTDENAISPTSKSLIKSKTRSRPSSVRSTTESGNVQLITKRPTRRRNRTKPKEEKAKPRKETRRTTEAPVYSSLELVTPSYTTPAPPSTPDQGGAFKCEDEGFYPHPKDCKKYFWCLSGPGELGIIAHQFTCPAGLYFNKAADSCDYTRNVLCNKKLETSKSTTTTTEATTSKTTTTRRTTIPTRSALTRTTTTTEPYEDEYEYEDEEDDKNSEEDPKVIKELFDLIRKAGGIEELERQLKIQEEGGSSSNSGATTQSSISKSLVERVLSKAARNGIGKKNTYSVINRNSRGPQNEGLSRNVEKTKENKQAGRPQYTTIARQSRPQNSENQDEEDENDEDDDTSAPKFKTATHKEYVNIQRGRSTTSKDEASKSQVNRNKILGEDSDDDIEDEEEEKKKTVSPQYVNIRRQRPSTTEETSTSKYTVIRRGTTESGKESENDTVKTTTRRGSTNAEEKTTTSTESRYKTIKRGSSTESPVKKVTITNAGASIIDSSTLKNAITSEGASTKQSSTEGATTITDIPETTFVSVSSPGTLSIKTLANLGFVDVSSTVLPTESTPYGSPSTPILLEPRPFSISTTRGSTLKPIVTESATKTTKVSEISNPKLRVKIDGSTSTEKPTPFRTRAPSRSRQPNFNNIEQTVIRSTASPSVRIRKRFSTTTELYSDNDGEYDLTRNYRPVELADFSSLTAVDFRTVQGLQNSGSSSRRRRLRPPSTTEAVAEEKLGVGSRTSPLARKQLSSQSFGNSNRRASKPEVEDQVKSSSDSSSHRVRGITRATTPSVTTTESRSTIRGRKVIRRLKPTTEQPAETRSTSRRRLILRPTTPKTDVIETASTNGLLTGRRFSRPPTTYKEIDLDAKQINDLEKSSVEKVTAANFDSNENSDESTEDGENIKLSESNIRENNDVNNNNVISDDGKPARKVLKRILSKNENNKPAVTEPNIIVRTRKIVRKLRPTEPSISGNATTESSEASTVGHRRKIFRRLRPTTEAIVEFGDHSSTVQGTTENKTLFIRGRPLPTQQLTDDQEVASKTSRQKYKTIDRTTTSHEDLEENSTTEIISTTLFDDEDEVKTTTPSDLKQSSLNETEVTTNLTTQDITISNSTQDISNATTQDITILTNSTETNLNVTESSEENVTVKNYINPILDRQKNRPTFRRPSRITTANPIQSSTAQVRFRGRSRGTTTHSPNSVRTEFVPRGRNRFRATSSASSTTETVDSGTTEASKEIVTVSEFYTLANNSTEEPLTTDIDTSSTISLEEATTISLNELLTTTVDDEPVTIESTTSESSTIISSAAPVTLNETSEAVLNETTTASSTSSTTETVKSTATTETVKSVLRPLKTRPKYTGLKKLTAGPVETTTVAHAKFSPKHVSKLYSAKATTPSTFKNRFTTKDRQKIDEERNEEKLEEVEDEKQENERPKLEKPKFKPRLINRPNKPSEEIDTKEELSGIDTDAVRNRNKNLFSKKRQMNTPAASSTEAYVEAKLTEKEEGTETPAVVTTTPAISESVTKPTGIETTTEYPTTLHHIFAETEPDNDTNTETSTASLDTKLIEKLIEVSRIIEVHSQEEMKNLTSNDTKVENRIGAINRVTHIEVVDPNPEENELNGTGTEIPRDSTTVSDRFLLPEIATVREISASEIKGSLYNLPDPFAQIARQDRKYEVYGNGKTQYNVGKFEIIDGRSHINIITPRPYYSTEASTIALEGLFQTDTPQKLHDLNVDALKPQVTTDEELLETDNSRYVNVRVLGQDRDDKAIKSEKTVNHDDYITMKAQVVEVTPKSSADTIKIVPIKVEMSRKLINPSDFKTKVEEDVQKVELKVIHTLA